MTTLQTITVKEFLDSIHGSDALIYFNVGNLTWKNKPQTFSEAEPKLKMLNSKKNKDICYIVNSGGTTDSAITQINAAFADWDCGRDNYGNYFAIDIVKQLKQEFLPKIMNLELSPNFIVETRNGYQTYWLLNPGTTNEQFIDIQKRIAYYFKSDPSVCNPARVMRLPDFYWLKPHKNCDPYLVSVSSYYIFKYNINSLFKFFPSITESVQSNFSNQQQDNKNSSDRKGAQINTLLKNNNNKVNTCDIYLGSFLQKEQEPILLSSSVIDTLKKQNLIEYMNKEYKTGFQGEITYEKSLTVKCPFHEDETPSASIFIDKDSGYYKFCCHSSQCKFSGSIIDVVMKKNNIGISGAVELLIKYYNIKEDDTWITEHKEMLLRNIKIIENLFEIEEQYPHLYRVLHRVKNDLLSKLVYVQENIKLRTSSNHNIIIASLSKFHHLASGLKNDGRIGRQDERIDRYCFLGLMRKLHDDEIPKTIRANAYGKREKTASKFNNRGKSSNMKRTQFYSIPEYTPELLKKADNMARSLKEKGIRLKALSRDLILKTFGLEKAQELYPQIQTEKISKSGEIFMAQVETILLERLDSQGFCSVGYIIEVLLSRYDWKSITDRRVKKYIPALLVKHGLMELTANKELKKKLKIESKGYLKLIIKKEVVEQRKSYSPVVRTVDVFPTRSLINSVIRKGSMFKTIGLLTAQMMSQLSAA